MFWQAILLLLDFSFPKSVEVAVSINCISKNGKQYTRAFDDVDKHCFPVFGKENEYKGYVTMYYEYEGRDIEVEYSVWYKTV